MDFQVGDILVNREDFHCQSCRATITRLNDQDVTYILSPCGKCKPLRKEPKEMCIDRDVLERLAKHLYEDPFDREVYRIRNRECSNPEI